MPEALSENPYTSLDGDAGIVERYRRVHANSEQTHVVIIDAGSQSFVAIAYDIDPRDYTPVAGEPIAYDPTLEGVRERAHRWMTEHPKGILGDEETDGGGIMQTILGVLGRLNDYGNSLANTQQSDTTHTGENQK